MRHKDLGKEAWAHDNGGSREWLRGEKVKPGMHLKTDDTIVFIGDSITDAERHRQVYNPLGFGYVHFVGNLLWARRPELNLSIINMGVSGETVRDLEHRWQRDCLAYNPDIVSILVGINDVWQLTMEPALARTASTPSEYEVTYGALLSRTKKQCDCQFVLMEPFMFCRDGSNRVFNALMSYIEIVRGLAAKYNAVLVPLQQEIDRQIAEIPPEKWSDDMVHPYLWAHAWIALRWLEATGQQPSITR
jgi:lysophospholipase L1-like esterase